jgi:hypothetical protein
MEASGAEGTPLPIEVPVEHLLLALDRVSRRG